MSKIGWTERNQVPQNGELAILDTILFQYITRIQTVDNNNKIFKPFDYTLTSNIATSSGSFNNNLRYNTSHNANPDMSNILAPQVAEAYGIHQKVFNYYDILLLIITF